MANVDSMPPHSISDWAAQLLHRQRLTPIVGLVVLTVVATYIFYAVWLHRFIDNDAKLCTDNIYRPSMLFSCLQFEMFQARG